VFLWSAELAAAVSPGQGKEVLRSGATIVVVPGWGQLLVIPVRVTPFTSPVGVAAKVEMAVVPAPRVTLAAAEKTTEMTLGILGVNCGVFPRLLPLVQVRSTVASNSVVPSWWTTPPLPGLKTFGLLSLQSAEAVRAPTKTSATATASAKAIFFR